MRSATDSNTLTLFLDGRVDTNNAAKIEEEVFEAVNGNIENVQKIVIDAEALEYTSSAGLRVLMKLRKSISKPLSVINVSRDVYDIFETTGFTELLDVRKALRKVSTEGMKIIGSGFSGDVYRMDEETVIKVFRPNVSFDLVISKENQKARNAFVAGVPTAIPYDIVRVGDCYGTVYEMLDAKDLVSFIADDREHLDEHIGNFAKLVKNMHSIKADLTKFSSVKRDSVGALPYLASVLTGDEMTKLKAFYECIPDRDTFIHGDCHIGNVMVRDGEMMFIDLGTAGTGHPIFDMVSMYSLFVERADNDEAIAASPVLRPFTKDEIKRIWSVFIHTYLGTDDEELIAKTERQIAALSLARRLFMVIAVPGSLSPEVLAGMKNKLFSMYDSGLGEICF